MRLEMAVVVVLACLQQSIVEAHEYWLEPVSYYLREEDPLLVHIRNGELFAGSSLPYIAEKFSRFDVISPSGSTPVGSRIGDYPAVQEHTKEPGLHAVLLRTEPNTLAYDSIQKLQKFIHYHALEADAARLNLLAIPVVEMREQYQRFARTLVQVGEPVVNTATSETKDIALTALGMQWEIVPLTNPYLMNVNTMLVELRFDNELIVNTQIELYHRIGETTTRTLLKTDDKGRCTLPVDKPGSYLLNSVKLLPSSKPGIGWKTLWTSLTFERAG